MGQFYMRFDNDNTRARAPVGAGRFAQDGARASATDQLSEHATNLKRLSFVSATNQTAKCRSVRSTAKAAKRCAVGCSDQYTAQPYRAVYWGKAHPPLSGNNFAVAGS